MKFTKCIVLVTIVGLLQSCGTYFNQPFAQNSARVGERSKSTNLLEGLPEAQQPVEVAVYNFRDQTGQYKAVENGSTFSTAVTQGATTILLKALEDSGWFIPIERENLGNLTTERNIIRNTKQEYIKNLNPNEPPLPPLKYAGILLEGGIISYDTNIVTGGIGARYFGLGGSARYRQDRITLYLRMVSTSNGEILKTVYVSKTILSQALDANFFRFVKFQRLLEAETGITQNEPVQLAVKDAVEKAVHSLIVEGVQDGYWSAKGGREINDTLVAKYVEDKKYEESIDLYDRVYKERDSKLSLGISGGASLIDGDYADQQLGFMGRLGLKYKLNDFFSVEGAATVSQLDNGMQFSSKIAALDLNAHLNILPKDDFAPFIYAGTGMLTSLENTGEVKKNTYVKFQYGAGLEYFVSNSLGVKVFAEHNITFTDYLDKVVSGKRDDFYLNFGVGLNYYFKSSKKKERPVINIEN